MYKIFLGIVVVCIIAVLGIFSLNTAPPAADSEVVLPNGNDVTLAIGQTGEVAGLQITFNAFVQDSRCPVDVVCIEAGAVNVNVTLKSGSHSETKNMPSDEVPYQFDQYKVSIVDVGPPRVSTKEPLASEYRVTFHVSN